VGITEGIKELADFNNTEGHDLAAANELLDQVEPQIVTWTRELEPL
jgi:hypothetical protein